MTVLLALCPLALADGTAVVQAGVGVTGADLPVSPGVAWYASLGWTWGTWSDPDRMAGRWEALALQLRQDVVIRDGSRETRTAPMLEYRRGLHLLFAGGWIGAAAGPLFSSDARSPTGYAGGTVRASVGLSYRVAVPWSVTLRLEAGADVTDVASPVVGLTLGLEHLAR